MNKYMFVACGNNFLDDGDGVYSTRVFFHIKAETEQEATLILADELERTQIMSGFEDVKVRLADGGTKNIEL